MAHMYMYALIKCCQTACLCFSHRPTILQENRKEEGKPVFNKISTVFQYFREEY